MNFVTENTKGQSPLTSLVKTDESTAEYKNGVLTITVPKVEIENKEPKKLEIKET